MKHLAPLLFLSALSAAEPTATITVTSTPGLVHAMAGIWHEGTDLKQKETSDIAKVERGQRQYALFAGLNKPGSGCGHVSENGRATMQSCPVSRTAKTPTSQKTNTTTHPKANR